MPPQSYPQTNVIMLTYSIASRHSFERLHTKWLPEIHKYLCNVPIVLVGTKEDLRVDDAAIEWVMGGVEEVPVPLADSVRGYRTQTVNVRRMCRHEVSAVLMPAKWVCICCVLCAHVLCSWWATTTSWHTASSPPNASLVRVAVCACV